MLFRAQPSAAHSRIAPRSTAWRNTQFSQQTGEFTVEFDAYPLVPPASMNCIIGLSQNSAGAYENVACIVRFFTGAVIDARDGADYAADVVVSYGELIPYHFRLVVNVSTHTYDVFVTPPSQGEITLGSGFAFRTDQASATSLSYLTEYNLSGDCITSGFSIGSSNTVRMPAAAQLVLGVADTEAPSVPQNVQGTAGP